MKLHCALIVVLSACLPAISNTEARAQGWGSVEGQFVLEGEVPELAPLVKKGDAVRDAEVCAAKDVPDQTLVVDPETKGIANIFIYMRRAPSSVHPDSKNAPKDPVVFDQKNFTFIPHALLVRTGQEVLVKSSDPISHNTHTHPVLGQAENFIIPAGAQDGVPMTFSTPEFLPTQITCDIHPHMKAYWLILDHPYAAITDKDGKFRIDNLPEGEHTFTVWQERVGYLDRKLGMKYTANVKAGQVTELESVKVPASTFK